MRRVFAWDGVCVYPCVQDPVGAQARRVGVSVPADVTVRGNDFDNVAVIAPCSTSDSKRDPLALSSPPLPSIFASLPPLSRFRCFFYTSVITK